MELSGPYDDVFDDQDLGFFTNFLGIFIFVLVIAYHF
uniref:Dolichyl-diphosphooligosaccharide--protein glycosyltransferase subunit 4A n=1 Tax=Aegilops tauschii subsp. strangulata TaxID=200361 RepID=A0A453B2D8_AEGTS